MAQVTSSTPPLFTTESNASYNSTPTQPHGDDEELTVGTIFFQRFRQTLLWVSFLLAVVTLGLIIGHRSLRKQHHIFSFNVVLADLLGIITFLIYDFTVYLDIEVFVVLFLAYIVLQNSVKG